MKKFIVLIGICIIVLSFSISFATTADEKYIADFLVNIKVLNGYPGGDLKLNNTITREEFSKLIVLASTFKEQLDLTSKSSPFSDVTKERWSSPYIKVAAQNSILQGYPDLTFKPENNIKLEEAAVIALRVLNYTSKDYGISWPYSQIAFAKEKNILDNINTGVGENITRKDAINVIYNTLMSNINGKSIKYFNLIDYTVLENVVIFDNENSLVSADTVLTSKGQYKMKGTFDKTTIGTTGTVVFDLDGKVVSIVPNNQRMRTYRLLSIASNGVIVSDENGTRTIEVNKDTIVYYKAGTYTLSSITNVIGENMMVKVLYNNENVEYLAIVEMELDGPYRVLDNNWKIQYSILNDVTMYKNGKKIEQSDIVINDVIYYSKQLNEVYAYNKKVAGSIEEMLPTKENVSSIRLNNQIYTFENINVYNSLQKYDEGKYITALLGKDGKIAYIVEETINMDSIGIIVSAGSQIQEDANGKYSTYYVDVLECDTSVNRYIVSKNYSDSINNVVEIKYNNGVKIVANVNVDKISGKVNTETYKIGNNAVSKNVEIIEVAKIQNSIIPKAVRITFGQLNGMSLAQSNILSYTKDSNGKINKLIITDVTNNMFEYGILLSVNNLLEYNGTVIYTYFQNGRVNTAISQQTLFNVDANKPVGIIVVNNKLEYMKNINEITSTIDGIKIGELVTKGNTYKLNSNVAVYNRIDTKEYQVSNLDELLQNKSARIKAYYENDEIKVLINVK